MEEISTARKLLLLAMPGWEGEAPAEKVQARQEPRPPEPGLLFAVPDREGEAPAEPER